MKCGHLCKSKNCGECYSGRIHKECQEQCERVLICGHKCDYPCSKECPPCMSKCENCCIHSSCQYACSLPCKRCTEKCAWNCEHEKCSKLCFEFCDRKPCYHPCVKKLKCNHACSGFCGETCPPICRVCEKGIIKQVVFGFKENEEIQRFIYLEDCGHIIESVFMENWIEAFSKSPNFVKLPNCPECKKPIRRNLRFSSLIKRKLFAIEEIKLKTNLNSNEIIEYKTKFFDLLEQNISIIENCEYADTFVNLKKHVAENKYSSKIDFMELINRCNIYFKLHQIALYNKNYVNDKSNKECLNYEIQKIKSILLHKPIDHAKSFSIQLQHDLCDEIKRLDNLCQYFNYKEYFDLSTFYSSLLDYHLYQLDNLLVKKVFDHDKIENEVFKLFDKLNLIARQNFRGFKSYHKSIVLFMITEYPFCAEYWYQCKNFHVYGINKSIGETENKVCPYC